VFRKENWKNKAGATKNFQTLNNKLRLTYNENRELLGSPLLSYRLSEAFDTSSFSKVKKASMNVTNPSSPKARYSYFLSSWG
jgi:hypothetical protein